MDWQIRIALIIVGVALIGFIVYDFQRRKKLQQEKDNLIQKMRQTADQVDDSGFDFTGVGSVRKAGESESKTVSAGTLSSASQDAAPSRAEPQPNSKQESVSQHKSSPPVQTPTEQLDLGVEDKPVSDPDLVFSLIVKAKEGSTFLGQDFMPLLLSQGLRHGEMGIFHRHSGAAGKPGPVMYSLANAINPGTFDLKDIERFETPAFAFFMTVPGPSDAAQAYENMVKTARLLKQELDGQILDESKSVFTEQTYQHHLETLKTYLAKRAINP
ncbi:cell division protein ZipA [Aliikangiella sp. IMCC44632]